MSLPEVVAIKEIRDETRAIRTFVLGAAVGDADPGQFVMVWLPGVDEKPFAIARPDPLAITVARVGAFSTALHRRKVGDQVGWRGPYGRGFTLDEDASLLLVAGGYGVGPLYFLATRAVERGMPTAVAIGARTGLDLAYVEPFEALGVELVVATDDGSAGQRGTVCDVVSGILADDPGVAVYACGPELMLVALQRLCMEHGIPGQFSLERYMKCGFGICGQCAIDDLLVCQDGPVFTAEELSGVGEFGRFRRSATGRALPIR
jgi:dihydroorotate dehydrogenase electron transfer subunit